MQRYTFLFILLIAFGLGGCIFKAFHSGSEPLSPSVQALADRAARGDATAYMSLGEAYEKGEGTPKDCSKALQWYRKAANQKTDAHVRASGCDKLSNMYYEGKCVPQDHAKAFALRRAETRASYSANHYKLAQMYEEGKGTSQNYKQALHWYKVAAKHGDHKKRGAAMAKVGDFYAQGLGVPQDLNRAKKWYTKADKMVHGSENAALAKIQDMKL